MWTSHGIHLRAPAEENLTSQQAACKNRKPTPFCNRAHNTVFLLGFSLNQNSDRLCGRSQNIQFQVLSGGSAVRRELSTSRSIRGWAFSTGYHPHHYTCSLDQSDLYPSLEFDPTTTEAEQPVIIVISTCYARVAYCRAWKIQGLSLGSWAAPWTNSNVS